MYRLISVAIDKYPGPGNMYTIKEEKKYNTFAKNFNDKDEVEDQLYDLGNFHSAVVEFEEKENEIRMLEETILAKKCELNEKKIDLNKKAYRISIVNIEKDFYFDTELLLPYLIAKKIKLFMKENGMELI